MKPQSYDEKKSVIKKMSQETAIHKTVILTNDDVLLQGDMKSYSINDVITLSITWASGRSTPKKLWFDSDISVNDINSVWCVYSDYLPLKELKTKLNIDIKFEDLKFNGEMYLIAEMIKNILGVVLKDQPLANP
jgi:hypothetical protein